LKLYGRTDRNHAEIVEGLRRAGAQVVSLASVGGGVPDLLVSRAGRNVLLEVKDPRQPPNKRKLTPEQQVFHRNWQGPCVVVETIEQALKAIGL
jgi:hypothetical protein